MSRMAALTWAPMFPASGRVEQVVESRLGGQVQDALGVVSRRIVNPRTAPGRCASVFQLGALGGKADFGEAEEDEAEDGRGVFLGLEAGVGAELVRGIPEAFLKRGGGVVFFGWGDPVHGKSAEGRRG
jgi:hypothetical protein